MKHITTIILSLAASLVFLLHPDVALADYVYTYTGSSYDFNAPGDGPIPAGTTGLTITLDSATALAANTTFTASTLPISITVSDGYYSANCTGNAAGCGTGNEVVGATVTTNSSGSISAWSVLAYTTPALSGITNSPQANAQVNLYSNSTAGGIFGQTNLYDYTVYGNGCCGDYGSTILGTWTTTVTSPVPLPAAVWMLLSGLGGLGTYARKRRVA